MIDAQKRGRGDHFKITSPGAPVTLNPALPIPTYSGRTVEWTLYMQGSE